MSIFFVDRLLTQKKKKIADGIFLSDHGIRSKCIKRSESEAKYFYLSSVDKLSMEFIDFFRNIFLSPHFYQIDRSLRTRQAWKYLWFHDCFIFTNFLFWFCMLPKPNNTESAGTHWKLKKKLLLKRAKPQKRAFFYIFSIVANLR